MGTYPVDLDVRQIVRWLIDEQRRGTLDLNVFASRSYMVEAVAQDESQRLGEEESEDLNDILSVGVLEVTPAGQKNGWLLRIRVEDRIGPRLPEDKDAPEDEEALDLETFEAEFITPERGAADIVLHAEDHHAKARFTRLFKEMLRDEHRAGEYR
jgi:hypothetical protein